MENKEKPNMNGLWGFSAGTVLFCIGIFGLIASAGMFDGSILMGSRIMRAAVAISLSFFCTLAGGALIVYSIKKAIGASHTASSENTPLEETKQYTEDDKRE